MTGEDRELFDDDETTDDEVTEGRELLEYTKRIVDRNRKRGHANFWNAGNEDQGLMEVNATKDWAKEMNKRGWQINMGTIQKNAEIYPDCLAEMDGKKIGVELTEMVDRKAIKEKHPIPPWPLDKFREHLSERVQEKDKRVRNRSLSKQFLLIVTDEWYLTEATTLPEYLKTIELQQHRNFDGIYVMTSYMPNPDEQGCYPVFEVRLVR